MNATPSSGEGSRAPASPAPVDRGTDMPAGSAAAGEGSAGEGSRRRRGPRRATLPAPAGTDPRPAEHPLTSRAAEDRPEGWGEAGERAEPAGENDARLLQDRPPHWG
ncbi:hypothetical protein [Leucobacter ruminantium]|uniref:Uncharacterized protein n=1 Tax=Leucobacter ruminantium TaxID=1289170 RepID=A0A939M0M5_9MICO|nr:hypothetical protein [Leucobacter ruminantium]MBO1806538.1 hypothetical protein [Leucobacter ruminantium]